MHTIIADRIRTPPSSNAELETNIFERDTFYICNLLFVVTPACCASICVSLP
jgi:hypothetical protein